MEDTMEDVWLIKTFKTRCEYLENGLCYRNLNKVVDFVPPWCTRKICLIRIE